MNGNQHHNDAPKVEPIWVLPLVDIVLVIIAFGLAYLMRYELQIIRPVLDPSRRDFMPYIPFAVFYAVMLFFINQSAHLYRNLRGRAWLEEVVIIMNSVTNATVVLLAIFFIFQPLVTSRLMLIYVAGLSIVFLSLVRIIRRFWLAYMRGKGQGVERVLIVGIGEVGVAVLRVIVSRADLGYKVVGYLDDNPERGEVDLGRVTGLGSIDKLEEIVKDKKVDRVIITLRWKHYDRILELARQCRELGVEVRVVPDIFQMNLRQVQVENLDGVPLLGLYGQESFQTTSRILKRVLDLTLIIISAPVWLLVIGVIAILVKFGDGGDIFFMQTRIGENGKEFKMAKFRTMIPDADKYRDELIEASNENKAGPRLGARDWRITRIGQFLRKTSLDELPNLFNVIKGEMSLVGPRPPMPAEVQHYEEWHLQRLQIIPGMTGLWQISGRKEVPFDEMVLMDIYYIENWSVRFDMQILLMTIPRVLLRSGAY